MSQTEWLVVVDAAVLATPTKATREEVVAWWRQLRKWVKLRRNRISDCYTCKQIVRALAQANRYPYAMNIRQLFLKHGIPTTPSEIAALTSDLDYPKPFIESYFDDSEQFRLKLEGELQALPEEICERLDDHRLILAEKQALSQLAYVSQTLFDDQEADVVRLGTIPLSAQANSVLVKGVVRPSDGNGATETLECELRLEIDPDALLAPAEFPVDWQTNKDLALLWAENCLLTKDLREQHRERSVTVTDRFIESVVELGGRDNPGFAAMAFKAAVKAAYLLIPRRFACGGGEHKALSCDSEGQPVGRASDGAIAWRMHVNKGHAALRLHYWERVTPNHVEVELVKICPKRDLTMD